MSATLERLKSEGKVAAWYDYRRSSLLDLSGNGNHLSSNGTPYYSTNEQGRAIRNQLGSYFTAPNDASFDITSGIVLVFGDFQVQDTTQSMVSVFDAAGKTYEFTVDATQFIFGDAAINRVLAVDIKGAKMVGVRYVASGTAQGFKNGVNIGNFNAANTVVANGGGLYIGNYYTGVLPFKNDINQVVILNDSTITDEVVSQIYEEYLAESFATLEEYELIQQTLPVTDNSVAFYSVDIIDGDDKILDLSNTGNDAFVVEKSYSDYKFKALASVGMSAYATKASPTGLPSGTDDRTIEALVYLESWAANDGLVLISQVPSSGQGYYVNLRNSVAGMFSDGVNAANNVNLGFTPPLKQWFHYVFTKNGQDYSAYINGELVQSGTWPVNISTGTTNTLHIGFRTSVGANNCHLAMANVDNTYWDTTTVQARASLFNQKLFSKNDLKNVPPTTYTVPNGNPVPFTNYKVAAQNATIVENTDGNKFINGTNIISIITRPQEEAYGTWVYEVGNFGVFSLRIGFAAHSELTSSSSGQYGYYVVFRNSQAVQLVRSVAGASETVIASSAASYYDFNTYYKVAVTRSHSGVFNFYIKGGAFTDWQLVDVTGGSGTNPVTDATYKNADINFESVDAESGSRFRHLGTHFGVLTLDEIKSLYN